MKTNIKDILDWFMMVLCIVAFCWLMIIEHEFEHSLTWLFLLIWVFTANCREHEVKKLKELCEENNIEYKEKLKNA